MQRCLRKRFILLYKVTKFFYEVPYYLMNIKCLFTIAD
jgi:hypothetical protein